MSGHRELYILWWLSSSHVYTFVICSLNSGILNSTESIPWWVASLWPIPPPFVLLAISSSSYKFWHLSVIWWCFLWDIVSVQMEKKKSVVPAVLESDLQTQHRQKIPVWNHKEHSGRITENLMTTITVISPKSNSGHHRKLTPSRVLAVLSVRTHQTCKHARVRPYVLKRLLWWGIFHSLSSLAIGQICIR